MPAQRLPDARRAYRLRSVAARFRLDGCRPAGSRHHTGPWSSRQLASVTGKNVAFRACKSPLISNVGKNIAADFFGFRRLLKVRSVYMFQMGRGFMRQNRSRCIVAALFCFLLSWTYIYTRSFADEITGSNRHNGRPTAPALIIDLTLEWLERYYSILKDRGLEAARRYAVGCIDQRRDGRRQALQTEHP